MMKYHLNRFVDVFSFGNNDFSILGSVSELGSLEILSALKLLGSFPGNDVGRFDLRRKFVALDGGSRNLVINVADGVLRRRWLVAWPARRESIL